MDLTSSPLGSRIQDGAWSAGKHASYEAAAAPPVPPDASAPFRFTPSAGDVIMRMTKHAALVQRRAAPDDESFKAVSPAQSCALIGFHRATLRVTLGGHTEVVTPNHLSLHAPGTTYSREAVGTLCEASDYIALSPTLLRRVRAAGGLGEDVPDQALFAQPFAPCTSTAFVMLRRLFGLAIDRRNIDSRAIDSAVETIASEALHSAQRQADALQAAHKFRHLRPLVEEAKELLAGEFLTELPLDELARRLHCSRGHLSRFFYALTGYRPIDFRNELRLRRGLALMEELGVNSEDIAAQLSFVNRSHFSRTLRKRFGITPTEYIRSLSGDALGAGHPGRVEAA